MPVALGPALLSVRWDLSPPDPNLSRGCDNGTVAGLTDSSSCKCFVARVVLDHYQARHLFQMMGDIVNIMWWRR